MIEPEHRELIENHPAGMVATVNADGTPAVSPKATFVVLGTQAIAFGNLRSPHTLANLRERPQLEVCFIDVVLRKGLRVTGRATLVRSADADDVLRAAFERKWPDYLDRMSHLVRIDVTRCELILSPAYDLGATEAQLRDANMAKLKALYD